MIQGKTIWVTGQHGQLGRCFQQLASEAEDAQWVFTDRREVDITSGQEIESFLESRSIDLCVNCAAYTDVDGAESHREEALAVNEGAISKLNDLLPDGIPLIHYSTDYVFDGPLNRPLREDDPASPASVYGQSKRAGEEVLLSSRRPGIILRTSWLYSSYGQNFVKTMLRLASEHNELQLVSDQIGSPTHALDLARLTLELIKRELVKTEEGPELVHYANSGAASWYDLAKSIFSYSGHEVNVTPVRTEAFPRPAPRPSYSVLDCKRVYTMIGTAPPWWKDSLVECLEMLRQKNPDLFPEGN